MSSASARELLTQFSRRVVSSQNSQISSFIYAHKQTHTHTEREREREREREVKEVEKGANIMCTVDKVRRTSAFIIVFVVVFFCERARDLISRSTIKSIEIFSLAVLRVY